VVSKSERLALKAANKPAVANPYPTILDLLQSGAITVADLATGGGVTAYEEGTPPLKHASNVLQNLYNIADFMTGRPVMTDGVRDLRDGAQSGNPMQMVRGGMQVAGGALPAAGQAAIRPVTTALTPLLAQQLDISMPNAQAAEGGGPPIPSPHPRRVQQPITPQLQGPTESGPSAEPTPAENSVLNTLWQQIQQQGQNIADGATTLYNEAGELFLSDNELEPKSFEEWASENGGLPERPKTPAEAMATYDGGSPTANERALRRAYPASLKAYNKQIDDLRSQYEADEKKREARHNDALNKPWNERYPAVSGAVTTLPAVLAGARYGRAISNHAKDVRHRSQALNGQPTTNDLITDPERNELISLLQRGPSPLPYVLQGAALSSFGRAAGDTVDAMTLPDDSEAKAEARLKYFPFKEDGSFEPGPMVRNAGAHASGAALTGLAVAGLGPLMGGKKLSRSEVADAESMAGLQNVQAMRTRAARDIDERKLRRETRTEHMKQDALERMDARDVEFYENTPSLRMMEKMQQAENTALDRATRRGAPGRPAASPSAASAPRSEGTSARASQRAGAAAQEINAVASPSGRRSPTASVSPASGPARQAEASPSPQQGYPDGAQPRTTGATPLQRAELDQAYTDLARKHLDEVIDGYEPRHLEDPAVIKQLTDRIVADLTFIHKARGLPEMDRGELTRKAYNTINRLMAEQGRMIKGRRSITQDKERERAIRRSTGHADTLALTGAVALPGVLGVLDQRSQ